MLEVFLRTIPWIEERGKYTYFLFRVEERECSMWEIGFGCSLQRGLSLSLGCLSGEWNRDSQLEKE